MMKIVGYFKYETSSNREPPVKFPTQLGSYKQFRLCRVELLLVVFYSIKFFIRESIYVLKSHVWSIVLEYLPAIQVHII